MTAPLLSLRPAFGGSGLTPQELLEELRQFCEFGAPSQETSTVARSQKGQALHVPTLINEFWTSKQCKAHSIHEVSYRACFKPQLPRFFMDRLTKAGDRVYDPFMGRGTTPIEAALAGRIPLGCDINPLSVALVSPRLTPPTWPEIQERLSQLDFRDASEIPQELLVFYHPDTLAQICGLRQYFLEREASGRLDAVDRWIRMVAINRLTGHSPGFLSVYTLPPNQAVSIKAQTKINERRKQAPPRRDLTEILLKKSKSLLADVHERDRELLRQASKDALLLAQDSRQTPQIASGSVDLVVTSPPFLDVIDYATDNWLRCWFLGIDTASVPIAMLKKLEAWQTHMTSVWLELARVVRPGGYVAFEVGEVRGGNVKLEETVLSCALDAGFEPVLILINQQEFTKTANCWGVGNNTKGTNTNRIVVATLA